MESLLWLCVGVMLGWTTLFLCVLMYFFIKLCAALIKRALINKENTFMVDSSSDENMIVTTTRIQKRLKSAFETLPGIPKK